MFVFVSRELKDKPKGFTELFFCPIMQWTYLDRLVIFYLPPQFLALLETPSVLLDCFSFSSNLKFESVTFAMPVLFLLKGEFWRLKGYQKDI